MPRFNYNESFLTCNITRRFPTVADYVAVILTFDHSSLEPTPILRKIAIQFCYLGILLSK